MIRNVEMKLCKTLKKAFLGFCLLAVSNSPFNSVAQAEELPSEKNLRLRFVTECTGSSTEITKIGFCNCAYTKLTARYGIEGYMRQDAILRTSNSKVLAQFARLAWQPEYTSCRSQ